MENHPRVYSPEARRRFSEAHGGIRNKISPFVRRKLTAHDICAIFPEFASYQISRTMAHMRAKDRSLKPTKEERSFLQRQSHLGKPRNGHGKELSSSEQKAGLFSRKLHEKGLIRDDLVLWTRLAVLSKQFPFQLPHDSLERLRLEAYLLAQIAAIRGIPKLLIIYEHSGRSIDEEWFTSTCIREEESIRDIVAFATAKVRAGRLQIHQGRGLELGIDQDGTTVFMTPQLREKRRQIREWIPLNQGI